MNKDQAKQYLLTKPESVEDYPFGEQAMVFKVKGKMFALISRHQGRDIVNLKCEPEQALALRDVFPGIIPGYHMNKRHWNTLFLDYEPLDGPVSDKKSNEVEAVPSAEVERLIDHSYSLVVKSLRKAERNALELSYGADALYR